MKVYVVWAAHDYGEGDYIDSIYDSQESADIAASVLNKERGYGVVFIVEEHTVETASGFRADDV